jgi:voltage-gated potassium channel
MQSPLRRILIGAIFFVGTLISAVIGYVLFHCSLITSIYMVVITVFGVGYGEVCSVQSPAERIFTIFVIFAGYGSAAYTVGGFIQMVAEGEIHRALDQRRKTQDIANLQQHTIICGYGRIGQVLARRLTDDDQPFVIMDNNPERIATSEAMGYRVYQGNATDEQALLAVGIERAKVLATVLPDDAANVFITLTARGLNPDLVIVARGELTTTEKKLRLAGADHVVLPASISGLRMANLITQPTAVEFLDQSGDRTRLSELLAQIDVQVDELTISPTSPLVGRAVRDLEVWGKGAFIVVALRKKNGEITTHPDHSMRLDADDIVIVLGRRGDVPQFTRLYETKRKLHYRGVQS